MGMILLPGNSSLALTVEKLRRAREIIERSDVHVPIVLHPKDPLWELVKDGTLFGRNVIRSKRIRWWLRLRWWLSDCLSGFTAWTMGGWRWAIHWRRRVLRAKFARRRE